MQGSRLRVALAAAALLGLCAVGCNLRPFRVQIPSFETAQVKGLWVWRAGAGGDFERFAQIEFGELANQDGVEFLPYTIELEGTRLVFSTPVVRTPTSPEDVTLSISFRNEMGSYKLSSYNAVGESALSDGTMVY